MRNASRFMLLLLIWSFTPLLVVINVQEMPAMWAFCIRFLLAAPIAHIVLRLSQQRLPRHKKALKAYVAGALGIYLTLVFCYLAANYLPSSIISMTFGLSPLLSGVIGLLVYGTRLGISQWLGIVLGVGGLMVALGLLTGSLYVSGIGMLFVLSAVLANVVSLYLVNAANANISPLAQSVGALWVSFLAVLVTLPFIIPTIPTALPSIKAMAIIGVLVVFGSILAFICLYDLNKRVSPTAVSLVMIATPVLATLWGNLFNAEAIHASTLIGLVMIVTGLSLYVWGQQRMIDS